MDESSGTHASQLAVSQRIRDRVLWVLVVIGSDSHKSVCPVE